jgi:hypothetical protein
VITPSEGRWPPAKERAWLLWGTANERRHHGGRFGM